jgi:hypothetical protein
MRNAGFFVFSRKCFPLVKVLCSTKIGPVKTVLPPWQEVAVDLIGPWNIRVNGRRLNFRALTIIDTVTSPRCVAI